MIEPLTSYEAEQIGRELEGTCSSGDLQVAEYRRNFLEIQEAANHVGVMRCSCGFWTRHADDNGNCEECQDA